MIITQIQFMESKTPYLTFIESSLVVTNRLLCWVLILKQTAEKGYQNFQYFHILTPMVLFSLLHFISELPILLFFFPLQF